MSQVSLKFALRADVPTKEFEAKFKQWVSQFDGYIVAFETTEKENDHVHCIIDARRTEKALRSDFTRKFPECVGNKAYSLKVCDDDFQAYIRYICKGADEDTPPVIWARNGLLYTDEAIREAHGMFYVNQAAVKADAKKRKAVESLTSVQLVERECKKLGLKGHDREGIARVYLRLWKDARKPINVFAGRAVVNTVSLVLDGARDDDLVRRLAEV